MDLVAVPSFLCWMSRGCSGALSLSLCKAYLNGSLSCLPLRSMYLYSREGGPPTSRSGARHKSELRNLTRSKSLLFRSAQDPRFPIVLVFLWNAPLELIAAVLEPCPLFLFRAGGRERSSVSEDFLLALCKAGNSVRSCSSA